MINCTFEDGNQGSLRHVTAGCLIIKDGEILLAKRNAGLLEAGKWCIPAGFANRDETIAETGIRETLEETGWEVANLRLLRINDSPNRPHEKGRQNVDFIYLADGLRKVGKKDRESAAIKWFKLDELPPDELIAFDHIDSINLYKRYLKSAFQIPVIGKIPDALN